MTTSSIGNKHNRFIPALRPFQKGFTFIEIMTTLAILAGGLVMIYKSFFVCLDYQTHLACRAQANNIIENRIALTEQMLRDYKTLSFNHDQQKELVEFFGREIEYQVDIALLPKGDGIGLYQMDVRVSWHENKRDVALIRSAYISSISSIRKN
jgi:prepilin-type N-terminal cleavage/methylation domain-containing protein